MNLMLTLSDQILHTYNMTSCCTEQDSTSGWPATGRSNFASFPTNLPPQHMTASTSNTVAFQCRSMLAWELPVTATIQKSDFVAVLLVVALLASSTSPSRSPSNPVSFALSTAPLSSD